MSADPFKPTSSSSSKGAERDWLGEDDPLAELARLVGHPEPSQYDRDPDPYAANRQEPRFADIDPPGGWAESGHEQGAHAENDLFSAEPAAYQDYTYDQQGQPYEEQPEEEAGEGRRRGGLMMIGTVLGVVVLGTIAVAGYRFMSGSSDNGAPPVIKADTRPSKEVPESAETTAATQNKQNYDRAPDGTQQARVVEPEEPAERPAGQPRIISTGPGGATNSDGSSGTDGVRRVRTFVVRPDGSVVDSAATEQSAAPAENPAAAAPSAGTASTEASPNSVPQGQPQTMDQLVAAAGGSQPEQRPSVIRGENEGPSEGISFVTGQEFGIMNETGQPAEVSPQENTASGGAVPMPAPRPAGITTASITPAQAAAPQVQATQQPTQLAPQQTASATVPARTLAPQARGGFVVQISSQRTEADARGSFDALKRRFPQILGSYQPSIQEANLGDRGTYYRVRVGPFTARDEAINLCSNLKTAGGDCVVQAN